MNDFFYGITLQDERGRKPIVKFGHLESSTGSAFEPIWPGGATRTLPTTADTVRIAAGGNAADAAAGTGAQSVVVFGLDANYEPITTTLTPNGISASTASTEQFLRVDRAFVTTVGSGGVNAGNIVIEQSGGTKMNQIQAGEGQTQLCALTVPAGSSVVVVGATFSIADTPGAGTNQHIAHVRGRIRMYDESSNDNYQSWRTAFNVNLDTDGTSAMYAQQPLGVELPEKTDMVVEVYTHAAAAEVDGRLFIVENV